MKGCELKQAGEEGGGLIVDDLSTIADVMGGLEYEEVGNAYTLEVLWMPKEDYEALPEWGGW